MEAVSRAGRGVNLAIRDRPFVVRSVLAAAGIACFVAWVFAPNALLGGDAVGDRLQLAVAAALSAAAAAALVSGAAPPGWKTALTLALLTLALGPIALAATGAQVSVANPLDGRDYRPNVAFAALGVPFWPAVVTGAALWALAMRALSDRPADGGARTSVWERVAPLVTALLIVAVAVGAFGDQLHRFGSNLQDPPAAMRPGLVGVIQKAPFFGPTDVVLVLDDGREVHSPTDGRALDGHVAPNQGELYFKGQSWYAALPKSHLELADCWGLWGYTPGANVAWDRGDSILLPNGLELPKSPGFADNGRAQRFAGQTLYRPSEGLCVNSRGEVSSANDVQGLF